MNKKEQTYEILKTRILTEEYPMGYPLNMHQISSELGISNSPIREALNMLEKEGLAVSTPNSVPKVVELNTEDMFEISQIMFFLILGSYRYCVRRETTGQICENMEKMLKLERRAAEDDDRYEYTKYNLLFQRTIIEATGNQRLLDEFDHIYPMFFLCSLYALRDSTFEAGIKNQEELLATIRVKDNRKVSDILAYYYYQNAWGGDRAL